jgi:hypothetical protein
LNARLLGSICEAIERQLSNPRLLREPWDLEQGNMLLSGDWKRDVAERLLRKELRPTPRNRFRFEFHADSNLSSCRLLGLLLGKSLVEGNRPLFSKQCQLAKYLYKHILQWHIQRDDFVDVLMKTTNTSIEEPTESDLAERLFESTKYPISSLLDGVFTIVPQSFVFVFRSLDELEACLVADSSFHPSSLFVVPAVASTTPDGDIDL